MSAQSETRRLTAPDIRARKGGEPIVMLTSYHAHTARLVDQHADVILVGDSLGMVMHGMESTVPVTLDMMILQGLAVMRGSKRALVVVDMPFGAYEESREQAFRSAARILKETGCGAIKLEGGARMAETIRFLTERGVPVMAHVGLTPQSINALGSFKAQGRDRADWPVFSPMPRPWPTRGRSRWWSRRSPNRSAREITRAVDIPTIGIGASVACDGQVLVLEDMLGLTPWSPKFVKRYGELGPTSRRPWKPTRRRSARGPFPGRNTPMRSGSLPNRQLSATPSSWRARSCVSKDLQRPCVLRTGCHCGKRSFGTASSAFHRGV